MHASQLDRMLKEAAFSDLSTGGSVAREWDITERALELLLVKVRVRRNGSLPSISRLPPEILSMIFSLVVYADPPRAPMCDDQVECLDKMVRDAVLSEVDDSSPWEDIRVRDGYLGWIRMSHVCTC